jgi:5-methylcytosine-specific restriction endonuclease McrA
LEDNVVNSPVLVLNQNYEPLNVCRARRAVVLLWGGKAEVLENNSYTMHSASLAIRMPSVIRLAYLVKRPRMERRLSRREIFIRDNHTCQYCGLETRELTIDHVIPRFLGGGHEWDNLISACKACNQRKAGRRLEKAGMKLLRQPSAPPSRGYHVSYHSFDQHPEWKKYVETWN